METSEFSVKFKSLLRRAGLGEVPLPLLACVGILCLLLVVGALVHFWPGGSLSGEFATSGTQGASGTFASSSASDASEQVTVFSSQQESSEPSAIAVDVEGAVRTPGVYELAAGSRVADAVEMAGGLAANAARTSVNLAQKLEDGMQVYVSSKKEAKRAANGSTAVPSASAAAASSGAGAAGSSEKVNLNTASAEELQQLSGIGPALSQRIIDYREKNGSFKTIEELKEVSGIGDVRFESLKDSVCV